VARNQREVNVPDGSDAPAELRAAFWILVVVFNLAILAMSVGAMLLGFRGQWTTGGTLLVAGLLAFAFGVVRVRRVQARLGEGRSAET
jgi:hypothetical protein